MKVKKQKGITLISLVVTIIILIILAGITLHLVLGENGIIQRAKQAQEDTKYANAFEKVQLAVVASYDESGLNDQDLKTNLNHITGIAKLVEEVKYDLTVNVDGYDFVIDAYGNITSLGKNGVPDVGFDHPEDMGKKVDLKEGWGNEHIVYIDTSDGTIEEKVMVATVDAISLGNGEVVPVPKDFFYVGGTFETGVIISDNHDDAFDGNIDKTTYEYARNLKGNQFVWIPCSKEEYAKTDWGSSYQDANWDTTTPKAELTQIEKYGGFYVARYEAGLASAIPEFSEAQPPSSDVYNQEGIPQSKEGKIPWNFINWNYAKKNAESMYVNSNSVTSGLITGTQWDVILNKIVEYTNLSDYDIINSTWGNYSKTQIDYHGRIATGYKSNYTLTSFSSEIIDGTTNTSGEAGVYGQLFTTGASESTEQYHIFDLAGNLIEWTEEISHRDTTNQYRVVRGGSYTDLYTDIPVCFRYSNLFKIDTTDWSTGFRTVLYIK